MALSLHENNPDNGQEQTSLTPQRASHTAAPLDLSFKCLVTADEIKGDMDNHFQKNLTKSPISNKYPCNSVRLNNNAINDLTGFTSVLSLMVESVDDIAWLDLSFNELTTIDPALTEIANLKVLYLHGNNIEKLQEVDKLAALPQLRSLTLHGNPMESQDGYRHYVLAKLTGLKKVDFGAVTKQDRSTAESWSARNKKNSNTKRKKVVG